MFYTRSRTLSDGSIYNVDFNFCDSLPQERNCNDQQALAVESNSDVEFQDGCRPLTRNRGDSEKISRESNDNGDFLKLSYTTQNVCSGEEYFGITYEIFCDSNVDGEADFTINEGASTDCRPVFTTTHKAGCKTGDLNGLWRFVENNSIIFGSIFIVLGLYNLILGRKLIRPTLGLIFCMLTIIVILFLFYVLLLPNDVAQWVGWLLLVISIILGGIAGFFASKLVRIGVFFLGVGAGACIGLLLNNLVFYRIGHVAVLWVLMSVIGLGLGILSFFWYNYIVIICTSILGSYLFIRGISFFAGGFPNEFTVYERISQGDINGVPGTFFAYMAGLLVVLGLGIFIQIKIKQREGDDKPTDVYRRV